ncbi:hypothetical protein D3C78_1771690 [compost metagenome]
MDHTDHHAEFVVQQLERLAEQTGSKADLVDDAGATKHDDPGKTLDQVAGPERHHDEQDHRASRAVRQARQPVGQRIAEQ